MGVRDKILETAAKAGAEAVAQLSREDRVRALMARVRAIRDASATVLVELQELLETEAERARTEPEKCPTGHKGAAKVQTRDGDVLVCPDCDRTIPLS